MPSGNVSIALFALALGALGVSPARAERTKLLEVNLRTGATRKIDAAGPKSAADRELDSMLGSAIGRSFSTADLERIEKALRRFLRATRPRASARLLLFLYPGSVTRGRLKEMREILVDIDLLVDPCGRAICKDAVGKHVELIGRSLRQAVIRTRDYSIRFKTVTVRTVTHVGSTDYDVYRFSADQVVAVGKRGGGARLVRAQARARAGYGRRMHKALVRQLKLRRLRIARSPEISRVRRQIFVRLRIKTDRVRFKAHVLAALRATAAALASDANTPAKGRVEIVARTAERRRPTRQFHCAYSALKMLHAGKISGSELWSTYVVQKRKGAKTMTFDDADVAGAGGFGASTIDRTNQILASRFSTLAPCLQREARRSRRFKGVTIEFSISQAGRATSLRTKERSSASLRSCLRRALSRIRFQPQQSARPVSYPMYIQR